MPKIDQVTFNKLIKIAAFKAGLTGLFRKTETRGNGETVAIDLPSYSIISSHTGRRSFCTNYYSAGWPIQAIMAISGHKTEKEFLKYIKGGMKVEDIATHLDKIPEIKLNISPATNAA